MIKPTASDRITDNVLSTTPCRDLSLSLDTLDQLAENSFGRHGSAGRAADLQFKPNELRSVSLLCISLLALGVPAISDSRCAVEELRRFTSKFCSTVEKDRRKFSIRFALPGKPRLIAVRRAACQRGS